MPGLNELYQALLERAKTADPPIDHTTFWCMSYIQNVDRETGKVSISDNKVEETVLYYKNYDRYDDLPRAAQGEITRIEFERFKQWEAGQN